jgi:quinol monooxygenase YgiN
MTNLLGNCHNYYPVFLLYQHNLVPKNKKMEKLALLAWLQAKPGMEQEVADFLKSALPLAEAEPDTVSWYAWQIGESTFGIFDTFEAEEGRDAHLNGPIAAALMANADRLLSKPPLIEKLTILAAK